MNRTAVISCLFQFTQRSSDGQENWWQKPTLVDLSSIETLTTQASNRLSAAYHSHHQLVEGVVQYPYLFVDIDSADLATAQINAQGLLKYLKENLRDDQFSIFFSGSKGFHIFVSATAFVGNVVADEKAFGPAIQKNLAYLLQREVPGLELDTKIYTRNRMVRACNSINLKSGHYKIPLTSEELSLPIAEIQFLARGRRSINPAKMSHAFTRFTCVVEGSTKFAALLNEAKSKVGKVEKTKRQRNSKPTEQPLSNAAAEFETKAIIEKCRAVRVLTQKIRTTGSVTATERVGLARSLASSDQQEAVIHEILSGTEGYDRSTTSAKVAEIGRFIVNCDELISSKICTEPCSKYLTKSGIESRSPSYFGDSKKGVWSDFVSNEKICAVGSQLIRYHRTTSDLFDWSNALQFQRNPSLYAEALLDQISKGLLPESENVIATVSKPNGGSRQLAFIHFETELATSLFVPKVISENQKLLRDRRCDNGHAFGYLQADTTGDHIIRPWFSDYADFKKTVLEISRHEKYGRVYNDDLVSFYPSITAEVANSIVEELTTDCRVRALMQSFFGRTYRSIDTSSDVLRIGLPQGPLISHVIAARLLLHVDSFILKHFHPDEITLVRYCDDFVFFAKDESVELKLREKIIPMAEEKFVINFHKNIGSGKTSVSSLSEFREKLIDKDLFKYQIKFEAELAQIDDNAKRDLLDLVTRLFGNYDRLLRVDPSFGLKDMETQLAALRWRIPILLKEGAEIASETKALSQTLLKCLENPNISHKFQTTLLLIQLSLIDHIEMHSAEFVSATCELLLKTSNQSLILNVFLQLSRIFATNDSKRLSAFANRVLEMLPDASLNTAAVHTKRKLVAVMKARAETDPLHLDSQIWSPVPSEHPFGLSDLWMKAQRSVGDPTALSELFKQAGSDFSFHLRFYEQWLQANHDELPVEMRAQYYTLSFNFGLDFAKSILRAYVPILLETGLLSKQIENDHLRSSEKITKAIRRAFGVPDGEVQFLSNVNGVSFLLFRGCLIGHEGAPFHSLGVSGIDKARSIVSDLCKLFPTDDYAVEVDPELKEIHFISKFDGAKGIDFLKPYLSATVSCADVFRAEQNFFSEVRDPVRIHRVIMSARSLGIARKVRGERIVVTSLRSVILDSISGNYVYSSAGSSRLVKNSPV